MSESNSLHSLEETTLPRSLSDITALSSLAAEGSTLMERLGAGGMGEVYRFGDEALQRDLAIKILKVEWHGDAGAEARFLREARLTGSLQHPGIVPVHQLGRRGDGRPFYTMKLVRGRTLADLLHNEPAGPERLPRLLAVLEKVCQAVAFAHSKGVIHRDLKPSNIMVGEFGEVQVMDWGLAKELAQVEPVAAEGAAESEETVARTEAGEELSRAGLALGTPAYMPPEQAAGDWDIVDERADVFALGAILCQMLTGLPPYHGTIRDDLLRRARRGDLTEALARLEKCGADGVLVELGRTCLAAERLQRPRHAGVVAERLASYQAEVRERLRQAELERARAEVQALEERKRRRLLAALALAALVMLAGGMAVWQQRQARQAEADRSAAATLGETQSLREQARSDVLAVAGYEKAVAAAHHAVEIAHAGGASEHLRRQAEQWLDEMEQEAEAARKDRQLLAALLEVHAPREGPKYRPDGNKTLAALVGPTTEEQFASAFRDWGLDVDAAPRTEAAARVKARPAAVVMEVVAALDEWAGQRRQDGKREAAERVAELATALDDASSSRRRELRAILARDQLARERALAVLAAVLRPVPVPVVVPLGEDHARLRRLAEKMDPTSEPLLGLLTLTRALRTAGEEALAERLLRTALLAHPREVVLYHTLGQMLTEQKPPRWAEAVEFFRAARGLRPDLGVTLAEALLHSGRAGEGLELLHRMVTEKPKNPYVLFKQALALQDQNKHEEAEEAYRKAIALKPDDAGTYNNFGNALKDQGKLGEAEEALRKAIALKPDLIQAYNNLGVVLALQKKLAEAESLFRNAIALKPDYFEAYSNLGNALSNQGRLEEAEAVCREAIEVNPDYATAYQNLSAALLRQNKLEEGEAASRKAIALKPDFVPAYCNLSIALQEQGRFQESLATIRRGHELASKGSRWYDSCLQQLRTAERMVELEKKLSALLQGGASPLDTGDALGLAQLCQQPYQKRYTVSARLYADAFAAKPALASDLNSQNRYNAACSAALAAAGQGEDGRSLPDKTAAMFRRWALVWLHDDLTAYIKLAGSNNLATNKAIQQRLAHWRRDPDLASVRDHAALDRLPEVERDGWRALWHDVDELAARLAKAGE